MLTRLLVTALSILMIPAYATAQDSQTIDPQFDIYWAKRREVKNIHKRLFLKEGRHEFAIMGGIIPNDDFWTYYPVGMRYNYGFSEDLVLEVSGSYIPHSETDLRNFLETEIVPGGGLDVLLPQRLLFQAGLGVLWTPLHGKIAVFDTKLGHFDFGIAMGVMMLGTEVQPEGKQDYEQRYDVGGNVGVTAKMYLSDFIAVRLDYRHYFYAARDADDDNNGLSYPAELSLGVSFFTEALK
jgi:outer membrane beta-barrel protein